MEMYDYELIAVTKTEKRANEIVSVIRNPSLKIHAQALSAETHGGVARHWVRITLTTDCAPLAAYVNDVAQRMSFMEK